MQAESQVPQKLNTQSTRTNKNYASLLQKHQSAETNDAKSTKRVKIKDIHTSRNGWPAAIEAP